MGDPGAPPTERGSQHHGDDRTGLRASSEWAWTAILLAAAGLRLWGLDRTSLWYDEVVTMRVSRAETPAALVQLLDQLDGTRAPLHPLVLHAWLRVFGPTDFSGRSFSALCGVVTVIVVAILGRQAFDDRTGRWAAWLAAVCPPLVYYSQEARMYAWLVLLTCLSWISLLSFRRAARPAGCVIYGALLTALAYTHPLGLFMIAAHVVAYLSVRAALRLSFRTWLAIQSAVLLAILPWLGRYLDHGTDYPMPRHSIKFLVAVPIEYVGGNSLVLLACLAVITLGLIGHEPGPGRRRYTLASPVENRILMTWAVAPPVLMYVYSALAQPIFGPSRYHLFIAPAYLILLAHGLTRLPTPLRWTGAAVGLVLSLSLLHGYSPTFKVDWRGLAAWLEREHPRETAHPITVVIYPSDPRFSREPLETARYYIRPPFRVILAGEAMDLPPHGTTLSYEVVCLNQARPQRPQAVAHEFVGLLVRIQASSPTTDSGTGLIRRGEGMR